MFPENVNWNRLGTMDADRWVDGGWFFQRVDLGVWKPAPGGEQDVYQRSLGAFIGKVDFFIEWHVQSDGESSEIGGVAPASMVTGSSGGVSYHFTIAKDQVRFIRDNLLPIVFVEIDPEIPHKYRLELYGGDSYVWYIDGEIVDAGIPEGPFPTSDVVLSWRAKSWFLESTTKWDYIRYGTIPIDGTGDYDSDGQVDGEDFYFFQECFSASDVDAGPGCRFADFDFDTDVDCDDWTAFTLAWTAPDDPPDFTLCAVPSPPVPTASTWASALLTLILLTAGATALSRRTPCRSC